MSTLFEETDRFQILADALRISAHSPSRCPRLAYRPGDPASFRDLVAWRTPRLAAWTVPANHLRILFLNCLEFLDTGPFVELWSTLAAAIGRRPGNFIEDLHAMRMVEIGLQECQVVFETFENFIGNSGAGKLVDCMVKSPHVLAPGTGYPVPGMGGLAAKWFDRFFDVGTDPREVAMHILMDFCVTYGIPKSISLSRRMRCADPGIRMQFLFAPDPSFLVPVWYDHLLYDARLVTMQAGAFGLPVAPGFRVLFDCRPLEYALRGHAWETVGDRVRLDGAEIGRIKTFLPFHEELAWELGGAPVPDLRVVEATRDLRCPRTGRLLWRKGTVYGTPYYVSEILFPPMPPDELRAFRRRLSTARSQGPARHPPPAARPLEGRLRSALEALGDSTPEFRYQRDSDHLFLGCERFARGPAARILVHMLREHGRSGRTEFPHVALKYDRFITDNPKTTGFETYLKRLQSKLVSRSAHVRLDLSRRGLARLEVSGPSAFRET